MEFSQRICNLMDNKKISAYKMSKDTGISDRLIGYWRKGEKLPNAENLVIIATYFNTSTDYLLGRTDEPQGYNISTGDIQGNHNANINAKPEEQGEMTKELNKRFNTLSFDDKLDVFNYIKNLK